MSPDSDAAARLRERGYIVSDSAHLCATPGCGHGDIVHRFGNSETAAKGPRGACSVVTSKGRCKCRKFTPAGGPDGG